MSIKIVRRVATTLTLVGLLVGPNNFAVALQAGPSDPASRCVPQAITGKKALLEGTLQLVGPAIVGKKLSLGLQAAALRYPDPGCEGRYLEAPVDAFSWAITGRPSASSASLTQTSTLSPELVPDVAGAWEVTFTACPSRCDLDYIIVPPLKRVLSFPAIQVVEVHVAGIFLAEALNEALEGSRIQISATGAGSTVEGAPYTVQMTVPEYKYQQLCTKVNEPPPICAAWEKSRSGQVTLHTITPQLISYIQFGQTARQDGAPENLPLPIPYVEKGIDLENRAKILAVEIPLSGQFIAALDIDRFRALANNIHVDLDETTKEWSVEGDSVNLDLSMESNHPSIKVECHFNVKVGYVFSVSDGWSDDLCPDFDLTQMDLHVKLFPTVLDGMLTVGDATVTVQLAAEGVVADLVDLLKDVTSNTEAQIATKIHDKLLEDQTTRELGKLATNGLKRFYKDLVQVVAVKIQDGDLVLQYESSPSQSGDLGSMKASHL